MPHSNVTLALRCDKCDRRKPHVYLKQIELNKVPTNINKIWCRKKFRIRYYSDFGHRHTLTRWQQEYFFTVRILGSENIW